MERLLVVGAGGFLGSRILSAAKRRGARIPELLGTVHRSVPGADCTVFDMLRDSFQDLPAPFREKSSVPSCAVLCSACSGIDLCRSVPESYELNVIRTRELALRLSGAGYRVCFLSSDHVFDGKRGAYTEADAVNPVNEYGRQKVLVEQWMLKELPEEALVVRLSKQLCRERSSANLFTQWENQLLRGETIRHIRGMEISPTDAADSAEVILRLLEKRCHGIYHVCGSEHLTRKELFGIFLKRRFPGKNPDALSEEKDLEEFPFRDARPLKTWLNHDKLNAELNYVFLPMEKLAELYCKQGEMVPS